jgi:hypothetical protein
MVIIGTAQSITTATKRVLLILEALTGVKEAEKTDSFLMRVGDVFLKLYFAFQLRKAKRALILSVNSSFKCDEADVFLAAGDALQKVEAFEHAKYCYGRTVEVINDCDEQDMRLLALMGKLECMVAISQRELKQERIDTQGGYREAKMWHDVICQDLSATNSEVCAEIKERLSVVDRVMSSNELHSKVNRMRWIFKELN